MAQLIKAAFVALVLLLPRVAVVAQWRASPPPPPPMQWWEPNEDFIFSTDSFGPFMGELMKQVAKDAKARFDEGRISVLPVQRNRGQTWLKPELWYFVYLVAGSPEPSGQVLNQARVAIRTDNFYIVGFANKWGHWYVLEEGEGLIPNAVKLGFPGNYGKLFGGSANLHDLPLGMSATDWARRVLTNFNAGTSDVTLLKMALTILVVTICEAARFPRIQALIEQGWYGGARFTVVEERYVVNWLTFSCAILSYQVSHDWWRSAEALNLYYDPMMMINGPDQAKREVNMLLQSRKCKSTVTVYK